MSLINRLRYFRHLNKAYKAKKIVKDRLITRKYAAMQTKIEQLKKRAKSQSMSKLKVFDYNQSGNQRQLFMQLSKRSALIIRNGPVVVYQNPQKVRVVIHNPKMRSQFEEDDKTIPFEREEEHNTKLSQISFKQFIQYKGYLELTIVQMNLKYQQTILPHYVQQYFRERKRGLSFNSIESINLWYYKKQKKTTIHYDGHDNFLFVREGKKVVFLKPPNRMNFFNSQDLIKGKNVFDENANHAMDGSFDSFCKVKGLSYGVVSSGECLFIPRGWWHYIHSFGQPCIAVNVWGNSIIKQYSREQQQILLKHLIFEISERKGRENNKWQLFSEEYKVRCRDALFNVYMNNLRQ